MTRRQSLQTTREGHIRSRWRAAIPMTWSVLVPISWTCYATGNSQLLKHWRVVGEYPLNGTASPCSGNQLQACKEIHYLHVSQLYLQFVQINQTSIFLHTRSKSSRRAMYPSSCCSGTVRSTGLTTSTKYFKIILQQEC